MIRLINAGRALAIFVVLTLGSVACAPLSPKHAIADVDDVAQRAADTVWRVEADGCGWRMRGSAFAIDSRHLVTNRHVVANDTSPVIRLPNGASRAGKVIGSSAHPDIAVIEVAADLPAHLRWAPTSSLLTREPLVVIGYPAPAHVLQVSTGQILNFQGSGTIREAALLNAPVARGNSGGPGLRGDASVAGVVTQMAIPNRRGERVAIMFTADAVRPTVAKFLRTPGKVLSSCGLGPDYVPPVPKAYDIKSAPAAAPPMENLPIPSASARAPIAPARATQAPRAAKTAPPVTRAPCPRGAPTVSVTEIVATEAPESGAGWWRVDVRGVVRNTSSASINLAEVRVTVDGNPPVSGAATGYLQFLAPGQHTDWLLEERYVYSSPSRPARATATLDWYWPDSRDCSSEAVSHSGPDPTPDPSQPPQG